MAPAEIVLNSTLGGKRPPVWRHVRVASDMSLRALRPVIQARWADRTRTCTSSTSGVAVTARPRTTTGPKKFARCSPQRPIGRRGLDRKHG